MPETLDRRVAWAAVLFEKYGLSLLFLCISWNGLRQAFAGFQPGAPATTVLVETERHVVRLLLDLFTVLMLLFSRRPDVPPQNLKSIFVPLAATFYNVAYSLVFWFPIAWRMNLASPYWQPKLFIAGIACLVVGPLISLWSLCYLGRSFGVLVIVRKPVLAGPYRWVRHPMYLGWFVTIAGVAVANFSAAYFLLTSIHVALVLYRARLEEIQLAAFSPEYREQMKRTGFICPQFRPPKTGAV